MDKGSYKKYLASGYWKSFKEYYYSKVEKRCYYCGSTENIDIHHLTYENLYRESLSDVIPLCRECHKKVHGKKQRKRKQ